MNKKRIIPVLLVFMLLLTGCRLRPIKITSKEVEKVAKDAVNPSVHMVDTKPEKEEDYAGKLYIYSFEDERGIPFEIKIRSPYFSFIEYIKGIYEDYVEYRCNYKQAVMDYYDQQVREILDEVDGISLDEKQNNIIRISSDEALDSLEDVLFRIDSLYKLDYAYCGELQVVIDKKSYWTDARFYDYLVRYEGRQGNVFFSTSKDEKMSSEDIRQLIKKLREE